MGRAARHGVRFTEWPAASAAGNTGVRAVQGDWLATRGLPPLSFLADPLILDRPGDRRAFVASLGDRIVGVLWLSPVPARRGYLVEWIWRGAHSPNGVADGLLDVAVRTVAEEGAEFVTLGLVPLSTRSPLSVPPPAPAVRFLLGWTRAHARRFYRFDGLEQFKAKFRPERWEPMYLVVPGSHVGFLTLYAVADVFAGGRPSRLVGRALARAVAAEAGGLTGRGRRTSPP